MVCMCMMAIIPINKGLIIMAVAQSNLVRKQFLISEESVAKLEKLAETRHISASEVVRQAIDSYDPYQSQEMEMPELIDLVSARLKEAISSTQEANKKVANTLKLLDHGDDK